MREVQPDETSRARAFELWKDAPMPMVTLTKTFNVSRLLKVSRRTGMKFNMLLCWCIGRVASRIPEVYIIPMGGRLMQFDKMAVNVIVTTKNGGINNCDIPFSDDISRFSDDYLRITRLTHDCDEAYSVGEEYAIVGTSVLTGCLLDSAVNMYSGVYNNPFLVWGQYRRHLFKTTLPISLQFHHVQMDGGEAVQFLNALQAEIDGLSVSTRK